MSLYLKFSGSIISDTGLRIVTAMAKEAAEVESEKE